MSPYFGGSSLSPYFGGSSLYFAHFRENLCSENKGVISCAVSGQLMCVFVTHMHLFTQHFSLHWPMSRFKLEDFPFVNHSSFWTQKISQLATSDVSHVWLIKHHDNTPVLFISPRSQLIYTLFEPRHEKTNNVVSDQV